MLIPEGSMQNNENIKMQTSEIFTIPNSIFLIVSIIAIILGNNVLLLLLGIYTLLVFIYGYYKMKFKTEHIYLILFGGIWAIIFLPITFGILIIFYLITLAKYFTKVYENN